MNDIKNNYISGQVQRVLLVMKAMVGKEVNGISPAELAKLAKVSPSNITRALANLEKAEFVERLPSDIKLWRLSAAMVQMSNTVSHNLTNSLRQLQQDQHNYSRLAI